MYGYFLRRVRLAAGLTQGELSTITGIAQSHISAYETNVRVPTSETLNKLVSGSGFSLCAKFGDTVIHCPLPPAGWFDDEANPPRDEEDPPESGPPLSYDAPIEERHRRMAGVLALADAFKK
jgi:transcriptional regulator with XRE-family HTH domain